MPIIEEECKHCVPVWKLTELIASPVIKRHSNWDQPERRKWKVGIRLEGRACLEELRCAPRRRGWEDPPNLVPPARPRPTIYPRLILPPFRAHPRYPIGAAVSVGPGADDDLSFLGSQGPITFEGQIDETQDKVCCKPDVGIPTTATPPSQLQSCCSKKRDIICDCYVQAMLPATFTGAPPVTTVDECCIGFDVPDVFTYWTDLDPHTHSQHHILNETRPGLYVDRQEVTFQGAHWLLPARSTRSPKQMILDAMNAIFREVGGRGVGWSNCLGANIGNGYRFDPPEQGLYKATCPCRKDEVGERVEYKCP